MAVIQQRRTMAVIQLGLTLAYGLTSPLPLVGFPKGRAKIRMRLNRMTTVTVMSETSIRRFAVREVSGTWRPAVELGANYGR